MAIQSDVITKEKILALLDQGKTAEATTLCEAATREEPENPDLWHMLTMFYGQSGAFEQAVASGKTAVRLAPQNSIARFNLGLALLHLNEYETAIRELETVVQQTPGHGRAQACLGQAYRKNGQKDKAIGHFVIAIKLMPDEIEIEAELADTYEEQGYADEATALTDHILSRKPDHLTTNIIAARLEKRAGRHEAARERLQTLLSQPMEVRDRMTTTNLLAQVLDKLGHYPDAWQAFQESHSIARDLAGDRFRDKAWLQRTQFMRAALATDKVKQWPAVPVDDGLPTPRFLVGFPRSGTTLTEQIISTHSAVIPSDEQGFITKIAEGTLMSRPGPDRFPFNIHKLSDKEIADLRLQYWRMAEDVLGPDVRRKVLLDKLPLNIVELGLIHRLFPDAPVLVLLRDPRDVCLSAFMQLFAFNDAMSNFFTIDGAAKFYNATMGLWLHYKQTLENLKYLEVRYEDIVADLPGKSTEILAFMGLDWEDDVLEYFRKNRRRINTPSYQDVSTPIYTRSLGRWKNYQTYMPDALKTLAPFVKEFGYSPT